MELTRVEQALFAAAYFRARFPGDRFANNAHIIVLSMFYTGEVSHQDCENWFSVYATTRLLYDLNGEIDAGVRQRYGVLIALTKKYPELLEGGGNLVLPADPSFTACNLSLAGEEVAKKLVSQFPEKPKYSRPDKRSLV